MTTLMHTVTSGDGTKIAFERSGAGPAVVLVDGAMRSRPTAPNRAARHVVRPLLTGATVIHRSPPAASRDSARPRVEECQVPFRYPDALGHAAGCGGTA
jgi:hypothetical protein